MTTAPLPLRGPVPAEAYALPVSGSLVGARWATGVAAITLFVAAMIGMQHGEQGRYQSDTLVLTQVYGQDIIAVAIVLPALLIGVWRAHRGSARGLVVWSGALIYIAYWYHFYLDGIPFGSLYLLHVTVVGSSLFALGVLLARIDVYRFAHRFADTMPSRPIGAMMVMLGTVFATAWIFDVVERLGHGEVLDQVARGVYTVDLTLMLPMTIAAGFLLWRHQPWGYALSGPLIVNALFSMLTLLATSIVVGLSGVAVSDVEMLLFWLASVMMAACVSLYMRELRV
jgi:hypothetical protein